MTGIWGQSKRRHDKAALDSTQLPPAPRWSPMPPHVTSFTRRIEFDPGAPAFTYDLYGPVEYPVVAGYSPMATFFATQPPSDIYPLHLIQKGLGQSANMQPPSPADTLLFTPDQMLALQIAAQQAAWGPAPLGAY